jgi:hypothetical protein
MGATIEDVDAVLAVDGDRGDVVRQFRQITATR